MQGVTSSNLVVSTKKFRKHLLSEFFYPSRRLGISSRRSRVYHQGRRAALVSHHALACMFLWLDDIPQQVADDIHSFGVIEMRKRLDTPPLLWYNKFKKGGEDMKKLLLIFVTVFLAFNLSACATIRKTFKLTQERESVQSIEIYVSEQAYSEGNINMFREQNEPAVILDQQDHADFLDAVGKLKFEETILLIPIPMDGGYDYEGYVVAIVYENGGYDIIAETGRYSYAVGKYGQERHKYDYSDYCGKEPWADFFEKYLGK